MQSPVSAHASHNANVQHLEMRQPRASSAANIILLSRLFSLCITNTVLTLRAAFQSTISSRLQMEFEALSTTIPLVKLIVLLWFCSCVCCVDPAAQKTDHLALLSFKSSVTDDPSRALASWNESLTYCQWRGVTCGGRKHPDRVRALKLGRLNLAGSIPPSLSNLSFLRTLDLSDNRFHGSIPSELGRLSRLRFLVLANNSLDGYIPANLSQCSMLRYLYLYSNELTGAIPRQFGSFPNLEILNLHHNQLTDGVPPELGNLSSLQELDLGTNHLRGSIPLEIGNLIQLEFLSFWDNNLSGTIPSSIFNLSNLKVLHLPMNSFTGSIPSDAGNTLPNIEKFTLSANQFEGNIPSSLSNASNLQYIQLGANNFRGLIPSNLGSLGQLSNLLLHENYLQADNQWSFLVSLSNCSQLTTLEFSYNNLGGELPNALGNLSTKLQWLGFAGCHISGSIPTGLGNLVNLEVIELGENSLSGSIPGSVGEMRGLRILYLSQNMLSGEIPSSLGNLSQLFDLELNNNWLTGSIPRSFKMFQNMQALDLSYNSLSGTINGAVVGLPSSLLFLNLSNNLFHGPLPSQFGEMENLNEMWISNNNLSGQIPVSIGNLQVLQVIHMENNYFEGTIPTSFAMARGLRFLNLSGNNMSGAIPEFISHVMEFLDLSYNNFEGLVPSIGVFKNMSAFSVIGNQNICGGLPELHLPECPTKEFRREHMSSRLKVTIVLVSIIVAALMLFCIYLLSTRLKCLEKPTKPSVIESFQGQCKRLSYIDILKATNGFSQENLIGIGSFGSVYRGILDVHNAQESSTALSHNIAVKVLNLQQKGAFKSFVAECDALKNIRHRNLVKVITSCSSVDYQGHDFKAIVFEYMPNGSLDNWLHPQGVSSHIGNLNIIHRISIAMDVASALEYMHENHGYKPIIHSDLKPSNILLDNDMTAHVSDFGLSRFLLGSVDKQANNSTSSIGIRGTIGYIAPEHGGGAQISLSSDIYSYGVLLLEMITGKRPTTEMFKDGLTLRKYVEMAFPERMLSVIDPRLLSMEENNAEVDNVIEIIRDCSISILKIGLSCSVDSPRERMDIRNVVKELVTIKDKLLTIVSISN